MTAEHTHKTKIHSRLEILLAKIAGHDIDLPSKSQNLLEELLYETSDRVKNISDSVPVAFVKINVVETSETLFNDTISLTRDTEYTWNFEFKLGITYNIVGTSSLGNFTKPYIPGLSLDFTLDDDSTDIEITDNGITANDNITDLHLTITSESFQCLDQTWQEINDAIQAGYLVYIRQIYNDQTITYLVSNVSSDQGYQIGTISNIQFVAENAEDYPILQN